MAERNPFIPSERRQEMEDRTRVNEEEANRRYAEKQAKLRDQARVVREEQQALLGKEPETVDNENPEA